VATIRVRQTKAGRSYEVQVRRRGQKPVTKTFCSKTRAKDWGRDTEAAIARGEEVTNEASRHTLAEAIDAFLRERTDLDGSDARRALLWWKEKHGERRLSAVTQTWLREIRDELASGTYTRGKAAPEIFATVAEGGESILPAQGESTPTPKIFKRTNAAANRKVTYLRACLAFTVNDLQWMMANPSAKVKKLPEPRGRVRFLSDEERTRLLEKCRDSEARALLPFVLCALSSGGRAGELTGLKWQDLDLDAGHAVALDTKNGTDRRLYFPGAAHDALREYAKVRHLKSTYVFTSKKGGRFQYDEFFRTAVKAAEIEDFKFHDLRHTCASYLAASGATTFEIAEVLGHRTLAMVKRYSHLTGSHVGGLVGRVMAEKLGGAA
jgi:integrase